MFFYSVCMQKTDFLLRFPHYFISLWIRCGLWIRRVQLHTHHSFCVSCCSMTFCSSRKLPSKVPSGIDYPSKIHSPKDNKKLFCMWNDAFCKNLGSQGSYILIIWYLVYYMVPGILYST